MKNTKKCPKCGSTDILFISNDGHPDGSTYGGNNIMTGITIIAGVLYVKRYVCCNCGYSEEWIEKNDIEKLKHSKKIQKI